MDYYNILGVEKNATQDEIRKAFRKKAQEHHPDRGGDENKFKEVSEAYEILSDENKRSSYDQFGKGGNPFNGGRHQSHGFNMDDIFEQFGSFFGGRSNRQNRRKKGNDLRLQIKVTLEEIFNGTTKKVKYTRQKPCEPCNGKGGSDTKSCLACSGTGYRTITEHTPFGVVSQSVGCNNCKGTGQVISNPCKSCKGNGTSAFEEVVEITVPKGVSEGMVLNMGGYGNHISNGEPGDLHIFIEEV
jgi:molecular chaperone DnaJ